jgi:hypothetical protein
VKFIEIDGNFKKKLEELEDVFKRYEIVELRKYKK